MQLNKPNLTETILREGIELRRGKGLCPFHQEKTPSFTVNANNQVFHCFGCGAHGDVISFIMKLKGISFREALVHLGIENGRPVRINPAIAREKKIQKDYETAIHNLWEKLCQESRALHRVKIQVKENPGALTETGAAYFAGLMVTMATVDFKIDILLTGDFEEKIFLLREERYA